MSGSTIRPAVDFSQSAKRDLDWCLAPRTASRKPASPANGFNFASSARSVIQPSPIASVMQPARAGLAISSQRRGVMPLVLLLKRSGNRSARSFTVARAQQPRMDRRNAIRAVRADDGKVGHSNFALTVFLDKAYPLDAVLVAREARPHLVQEALVDVQR